MNPNPDHLPANKRIYSFDISLMLPSATFAAQGFAINRSSEVMKKHTHTKKPGTRNHSKITELAFKYNEHELNNLASELDGLARKALPDGVLQGILAGQESAIRNDAVVLALQWFLRQIVSTDISQGGQPDMPWHAPRAIAHALRFAKMRNARFILKGTRLLESLEELHGESTPHPSDLLPHDWAEPIARKMLCQGIRLAARSGRISHVNASIARLVYLDGIPVSQVAKRRGVHRSAIYQQIWKVRDALSVVLEIIEVPSMV